MEEATKEARSALEKAVDDMALWLNAQNILTTRPMKKLDHKWLGPCPINKVISCNAYSLELPSVVNKELHSIFSVLSSIFPLLLHSSR